MGLEPITIDEFAALEAANGGRMIKRGGVYWKVVRPFFYQPLVPWMEYRHGAVRGPLAAALGGWQHAVPVGEPSNSSLKFLAFSNVRDYKPGALDYNRRRQLKIATQRFKVREMQDRGELASLAYSVYVDFYSRTAYDYFSGRTQREVFEAWANRLSDCGKLLILGAFDGTRLCALSVSYLFGSHLFYATFFSSGEAQEYYVSDLMLHTVLELAAGRPDVTMVIATRYKGGSSLDRFYLLRGLEILTKPCVLKINPAANVVLKVFFPEAYKAVWGESKSPVVSWPSWRKAES